MNIITINGQVYETTGKNITIINDQILVNDKLIAEGLSGIVEVKFMGELGNLTAHNVKVSGNVFGDLNAHNVNCGNVNGDVHAHNVDCGIVKGSVTAKNVKHESTNKN